MPNFVTVTEAAQILLQARRVMVVGCSGTGKTTLSQALSTRLDLPYWSLDRDIFWLPGWIKRDKPAQRDIIRGIIATERWLMDGTNASSFDLRLPRADLVIWLRLPRRIAYWGLARRVVSNYGQVRVGMADGCPERFPEWDFLSFIWSFNRKYTPLFTEKFDTHAPELPVVRLTRRAEVAALLMACGTPAVDASE